MEEFYDKKIFLVASSLFASALVSTTLVNAENINGSIETGNTEGYIHFDSNGNIMESNLNSKNETEIQPREAINHESGRWVYGSEKYDFGKKKKGSSNHYSREYNRHGSKAKVGKDVKTGKGSLKTWAYATAYGSKDDTFSCWYNPTSHY